MALQIAAVMAALAVAQKFLDFPLVKRLLCNVADRTANQIDDWVVDALYGAPEAEVPAKLEKIQANYDAMPAAVKEEAKATPAPWAQEIPAGSPDA